MKDSTINLVPSADGISITVTLYDQNFPGKKSYLESVTYESINHILEAFVSNNISWKTIYTWTNDE
jgi:hypothetical protein